MPSYPGFLGPAKKGQSFMAANELCINWYLEPNTSPGAPNPYWMVPAPGFNPFASVNEAPGRGAFYQRGRAFFVSGFAFYELLEDGTTTVRGTVDNDGLPATINANGDAGNQLWITSGGTGYIFDLTSNVLSTEGVPGTTVSMGGFLSARFLYLDANTGAFYASALYDGTTWDATFVAQSQSGDPWRALVVTPDGLIRLLGESSGEAWADQGAQPFPFSKISNADIPFGIVSGFAWTVDTAISWVAQNAHGPAVMVRATGYTPDRISTHAIEATIQGYADVSDCIAWNYEESGHFFTAFTFPTGGQTWVIDSATGLWSERAHWNVTTGTFSPSRVAWSIQAFGKTLVGDRLSGDIYEMSTAFQTDVDGAVIRRVRQPPRFSREQRRITVHELQLIIDTGQGTATGQGTDPQMMLRTSRNGGKTWGPERWESIGLGGEWDTRVVWTRLGDARNFVPQFVATDPVPFRIVDLEFDYTVGAN